MPQLCLNPWTTILHHQIALNPLIKLFHAACFIRLFSLAKARIFPHLLAVKSITPQCLRPWLPLPALHTTQQHIAQDNGGEPTTKRGGVCYNLTQSLRHCQTPTRDVTLTLSHANTSLHRWTVHSARASSLTATARRLGARLRVCTLGVRGTSGGGVFLKWRIETEFFDKKYKKKEKSSLLW